MGILALIGLKNTVAFFAKKSKLTGSVFYFLGFLMIVVGWYCFVLLGFLAQMYGLFMLFKSFLSTILQYGQTLPFIGPVLRSSTLVHNAVRVLEVNEGKRKSAKFEV